MSSTVLAAILLITMALVYQFGLLRSKRLSSNIDRGGMHSRPVYHATWLAICCAVPGLLLLFLWSLLEPMIIRSIILSAWPEALSGPQETARVVFMRRIEALSSGQGLTGDISAVEQQAAAQLTQLKTYSAMAKTALIALVSAAGLFLALKRISTSFKARHYVEHIVRGLLLLCSATAIFTTIGIVLSMVSEAFHFFTFIPPTDFFFGTKWSPAFSSTDTSHGEYGLLPLLWGTFMVSIIAMLVAIPLGLMTAIYMAEYAPTWFRNTAKPIIEVLAGIPTIVYGVFALIAIGPFFAAAGELLGIQVRATSALTAGVVMGLMIIPFVSSLSDDIITRVPQSLRDGSLGLGATRSETIRQVVLPAALPGIVGAFLLAFSRAIGETMIVVLAAGNSPQLHANPLEAISTVTVSIVNQLTGDTDFAGPQSLVAFALGLTLFVITLVLNVIALYVVRKYREHYD